MIADEKKFNQELGKLIRAERRRQGLTIKNLADKLGVTLQQMQKYEAGENAISSWRLNRISEILGVSFSSFVTIGLPEFKYKILPIEKIKSALTTMKKELLYGE